MIIASYDDIIIMILVKKIHGIFIDKLPILRVLLLAICLFSQPECDKNARISQRGWKKTKTICALFKNNQSSSLFEDQHPSHLVLVAEGEKGGALYFNLKQYNYNDFYCRPEIFKGSNNDDYDDDGDVFPPVGQSYHRAES